MQNDEVALQRKVRTEVFQLEDTLAQVRKEYEMLRIEFEQTLAANEQAGKQCLDSKARGPPFSFLDSLRRRAFLRSHQQRDASSHQHTANPQPTDEGGGGQIQDQTEGDAS